MLFYQSETHNLVTEPDTYEVWLKERIEFLWKVFKRKSFLKSPSCEVFAKCLKPSQTASLRFIFHQLVWDIRRKPDDFFNLYILGLNSKREMCWKYINLFAYLHIFNMQLSVYLSANNSTRESISTKNAVVINHYLHLTCLSAGSAAEIKTGPTANITLYLPIFLVVNTLGSLPKLCPRPGELMGIDLINMSRSHFFLADKTEDPIP